MGMLALGWGLGEGMTEPAGALELAAARNDGFGHEHLGLQIDHGCIAGDDIVERLLRLHKASLQSKGQEQTPADLLNGTL